VFGTLKLTIVNRHELFHGNDMSDDKKHFFRSILWLRHKLYDHPAQ
jgi:hypothetical protein